jgi:PIN domain nuclease of toxin-antitoxin system
MAGEQERVSEKATTAISAPAAHVLVSAVLVWEVAIKRRLGKLDAPNDLLARLEGAGVDLLSVTARHADRVGTLPLHHRDPFDRLLIAQADVEGLALVTADSDLAAYGVELVW